MAKSLVLSSLDLRNIIAEMKQLEGGRLNKLYQLKDKFTFRIATKNGQFNLNIVLPSLIFISETVKYAEASAGNFSMSLRKRLDNALLRGVEQMGTERIIRLAFEKNELFYVVIELFSKGNLILMDSHERIISIYSTQSWSTRDLKRGLHYDLPPALLAFNATEREIAGLLKTTNYPNMIKLLAVGMGMGGVYAEETCFLGEIDKNKSPLEVTPRSLSLGLGVLLHKPVSPHLYLKEGQPLTLSSYELKSLSGLEFRSYPTMGKLVEAYIDLVDMMVPSTESSSMTRMKSIIAKQEAHIVELGAEITESTRKGELVYERYQEISALMQGFEEVRSKKGPEGAFEWISGQPGVKSIDKEEFSFAFEL